MTKASRSNFTYAFLVLPKAKREALYAIYAFCRISDDVVDEAPSDDASAATPAERLKAWRAELDACFRGEPRHPVTRRLAEVLGRLPMPKAYFDELLNGGEHPLAWRHAVHGATGLSGRSKDKGPRTARRFVWVMAA